MNMIVGAALTGTVHSSRCGRAHRSDLCGYRSPQGGCRWSEAVQRRMGALEDELQAKGRLQTERRLEDERRRGEEIEAALDQAWGVEQAAAYELLNVEPTTMAGVIALLTYACDYDDATHGMGWPEDIECEEVAVLLDAQENMQAPDTNRASFKCPARPAKWFPLPRSTSTSGLRPYGMRWTGRPRLSSGSGATNAPDPALCGACLLSGEHLAGNGREVARWLLTALQGPAGSCWRGFAFSNIGDDRFTSGALGGAVLDDQFQS
jgi:hypothetical protein